MGGSHTLIRISSRGRDRRSESSAAGPEPERAAAAEVSQNFFDTIGISPEAGRTFSPQEEVIGIWR